MAKLIVDSCVFINAFKADSPFRVQCIELLEALKEKKQMITMPAHGWFEVWCSLRRIEKIDKSFSGPKINGKMNYDIELIHIDKEFIEKYGNVDMPYQKSGDHIYTVIAFVNKYPLITLDKNLIKVAKELGLTVYTPKEYVSAINLMD